MKRLTSAIEGFFNTVDLGELQIRGHAPVHAFEVTGARSRRTRLQVTAERGLTPLVGRERELAALEDLFREVRGGRGQIVFIAGEAGIGKSRLLLEFRHRLESVERSNHLARRAMRLVRPEHTDAARDRPVA